MGAITLVNLFLSGAVAIISFFLARIIKEHDEMKLRLDKISQDLYVLENSFEIKHSNMIDQMDRLTNSMEKLSDKIDLLNDAVNELKYR